MSMRIKSYLGLQFNFSQNSNLLTKKVEEDVSLGLPPPIFSINYNISNE